MIGLAKTALDESRCALAGLILCWLVSGLGLLSALAAETGAGGSPALAAEAGEMALVGELADLLARHAADKRLVVLPLEQEDLPASPDALGNALNRVLSEAQKRSGVSVIIQSLREQMTAVLRDAEARGGGAAFEDAVNATIRGDADLGLSVSAVLGDAGRVEVLLSLHDLATGALLDTTAYHTLAIRDANRADPAAAIDATLMRFLRDIPESEGASLKLLPTTMGETGQKNAATAHFDRLIAEALSDAINRTNQIIRQQQRPATERLPNEGGAPGLYVSGTLTQWDERTVQLFLYLNKGQAALKSKVLFVSTEALPENLRVLLAPATLTAATGFDAFLELRGLRNSGFSLTLADRQGNKSFEVCPTPSDPTECDRLMLRLLAGQDGEFLCLVAGDDGAFNILRPNRHFSTQNRLEAGMPLALPDGVLADGGSEIWYAMGPPGTSLVLCALYAPGQHLPVDELAPFDGASLAPKDLAFAAQLVRESGPVAIDWSIVSINQPLGQWRAKAAS